MEKTVEGSQLQFLNKVDEMPVVVERQKHMVQTVQMPMETPQLPCIDKVVDVLVATQQVVVEKIVEISQLQGVGKIDEIPEIRTDMDTQTSESFGTAPVRLGVQAEIGEVIEIRAPIPAESASPMSVTEQKTMDVPQIQCLEPLAYVPVVTQQTTRNPNGEPYPAFTSDKPGMKLLARQ